MSSKNTGARSKIRVQPDSNARKGRTRGENDSSSRDQKKLWQPPTEQNSYSRNSSMDSWDKRNSNSWNTTKNKKDSWADSVARNQKEPATVWGTIEQEFPSLGDCQEAPKKNVWTERSKKFEEVKSLEPANEAEEEKMMKLALELSKFDVESDEAKRKRLEEEYLLQEEMLKANPDYFKEFVPEDAYNATNIDNNIHSEKYNPSGLNDSSNNNNWDTWNDYPNFGIKNDSSSKTKSGWTETCLAIAKSTSSKGKDSEGIWGVESENTISDNNWGSYTDSSNKKNSRNTSNYNSVDSFEMPTPKASHKSKAKAITKKKNCGSALASENNHKNSGVWNDYSSSKDKQNLTSKGASNYQNDTLWDDSVEKPADGWNDNADSGTKESSTSNSDSGYKNGNSWNDSVAKTSGWNDYPDSGTKRSSSNSDSGYKNGNSWNDSVEKPTDGWNDYSDSSAKKNSTSTSASSYKNSNSWDNSTTKMSNDWDDYSSSNDKRNLTTESSLTSTSGTMWDDSNGKSENGWNAYSNSGDTKASSKNSCFDTKKYEECGEIWGDADNNNVQHSNDNANTKNKINYSNLQNSSNYKSEPLKESKIKESKESKGSYSDNSYAKVDKSKTGIGSKVTPNTNNSNKTETEDIKKVVDLFGGWGSASDYARKPNLNSKHLSNVKDAADNYGHHYKNESNQKVSTTQPSSTVASEVLSTSKRAMQNSYDETNKYSPKVIEKKTAEIKLSDDNKSILESHNSYFGNEINQFSKASSENQNNRLITDNHGTTPKMPDIPKISEQKVGDFNVPNHRGTNQEPLTELNSMYKPIDSSSILPPKSFSLPSESDDISKPIESLTTNDYSRPLVSTTISSNLNNFSMENASQTAEVINNKVESPVINSPSISPPSFEAPILPINPMLGGFMNPNMLPLMNPGMIPGMNPMVAGGMNPLLMQQMLFLSNPFLASQLQAMEMYYRSMGMAPVNQGMTPVPQGMAPVPQGMVPPQMGSMPGFNSHANVADDGNSTSINAPVPSNKSDVNTPVADSFPIINAPSIPTNNTLNFSLDNSWDTSSPILKYDPDDADSLLKQFLEPDGDTNFIPPPVMPSSKQATSATNINDSSLLNSSESGNNIGIKNVNGANSESSWIQNEPTPTKAPGAAVPESTGWGDIDFGSTKCNWDEEIDGWGDENYSLKATGNPFRHDSRKISVIRQPSSQPTFSRFKK